MLYLVKNQLTKSLNRNRNKNNGFFPVEESELMPEKVCFVGQIDMEYESDEEAYKRYMMSQKRNNYI